MPVLLLLAAAMSGCASTPPVPRSFEASPDVYKVLAEDGRYRVIEATWKPGQRDQVHAHPPAAAYPLTDCRLRSQHGVGYVTTFNVKAGVGSVQEAVVAHSVENVGTSDCRIIMFEPR
ncbi:MAG: hypothetical protein U1F56_15935 [Rubrivivax sp.]